MAHAVFADPKTDFVFQRIFGTEEHKPLLISLINALLRLDEAHRVVEVELLPPEQRPKIRELKYSIVDVKCVDAAGTHYVVEMQVLYVEAFEKRVVYNVAKAYVSQLALGNPYPKLNDVIGISICNFVLFPPGAEAPVPMLSRWRMSEEESGAKGLDQLRLVFLELPKLDMSRPPETLVEKWAYFFQEAPNLEVVPPGFSAEGSLVDAFEAARLAAFTMAEWDEYTAQLIAIQDEIGLETGAEKRGWTKGLDAGWAKGLDAGWAKGLDAGVEKGRAEALRTAIESLCEVLQIPLNDARKTELSELRASDLDALLQKIRGARTWP